MKALLKLAVDALFVFSVVFIWLMLLYQFVLTVGGFFLRRRMRLGRKSDSVAASPPVTVLIPARNEEEVIEALLARVGGFAYPRDKIEILVINDGSTDGTARAVDRSAAADPRIRRLDVPPGLSGRGKGAALNLGLSRASGDVIAVYDADNLPEPDSLALLVGALQDDARLAAVCGKFRAYNRRASWLTRFINIESLAFQWIVQAGRWRFFRIAVIPGTNFVVRASVLKNVGGWNEESLTEDSELTFRLYDLGYRVAFLPTAVTWEQEPETLRVWFGQRTRWARGYYRLIDDRSRLLLRRKPGRMSLELFNLLWLYYFFVFAVLLSDILFLLCLAGWARIRVLGPYAELWALAFILFGLEVLLALAYEGEDSLSNVLLIPPVYLVYTKLWVLVVFVSLFQEIAGKKKGTWVKTPRFPLRPEKTRLSKEKKT
ncbi:MAG: glycosyltransferase family 2 protein [Candidatus Aminicenantes bacterium]|nr:glycosyltransferase family 2 protein [Candidatus Aminicenantes bacterium]